MGEIGIRRREIAEQFKALYNQYPEHWVRAPGRAELLGTDTDDNQGYVLTMSIHLDTWIAFSRSSSSRMNIFSMNLAEGADFEIGDEPSGPSPSWDRYVSGVSKILLERGYEPKGVHAVIHSTVPLGGGLSSSASLETAAALMFQAAGSFSIEPKQTALICQRAENESVGVSCGILDQYSSVFGKRGSALLLDCRTLSHIEINVPSDIKIVICDTNVPRNLSGSEYGKRQQETIEGTRILRERDPQILALRDVNSPLFERLKDSLPDTIRRRTQFIVEENQRVLEFTAAMVRNDRKSMKRCCEQSFFGLRDLYEKSIPEMERMFEAMSTAPGAVAARQSGGGFGGCMIAYVDAGKVELFSAHVREAYKSATGITPATYITEPSEGAEVLKNFGN
jgi:galactokinase